VSELTDAIRAADPYAVARGIKDDPTFAVFNLLWKTPDEIILAVEKMGWKTLDEMLKWVQEVNAAIRNTLAFEELIDPPVALTLDGMECVDMPTIHKAIAAQAALRTDFFIDQSDAKYRLATREQLEHLAAICPVRRRKWIAETGDCDDFVNAFRGWLATNGLGNLAQGFCGLTMYDSNGQIIGGHAVVLVMDSTRKMWFLEPQDGRLYEVTYPRLGGMIFSKSVKIARAYF